MAYQSSLQTVLSQVPTSLRNGTYRGPLSSMFNARNIAKEDFERQLASNALQNQFTADENEKTRLFNAEEAQKQRDFEAEMSNTAISRAYADMKNVGINPILAYSSSASTPSGASASGSSSGASSGGYKPSGLSDPLGEAVSTALKIIGGLVLNKLPIK